MRSSLHKTEKTICSAFSTPFPFYRKDYPRVSAVTTTNELTAAVLYSIVSLCQTPLLLYCNTLPKLTAWPSSSGGFMRFRDTPELTAQNSFVIVAFHATHPTVAESWTYQPSGSYLVSSSMKASHPETWWKVWLTGSSSPIGASLPSWIWYREADR